ncbi:DUF342 domain-containing protein [Ureibacillus chungkukjangi]|uniref:Flagellar Assembly Protein A N-terminal region domain-containing protein n=1 Tax=Ureibacillus chungkukjangi TaxID=1202712 RepID=A0A318TDU5_9BACL|nr:FapA family protein [Ureibacillus chungkukjangi]PYF03041.1 hypothetical protein BJ095_13529 [Ureibacillus chungkukjangi]
MIIFTNDFIEIIEENNKVLLKTIQANFQLKDFDQLVRKYPRIRLTNFALLKSALGMVSTQPVEIGQWLPIIEIEIAKDNMSANITLNETTEQIKNNQNKILLNLDELLSKHHITHGIKEIDTEKIIAGKTYCIAEGTEPVKGEDAKITYLEIPERKPVIHEDGKADYFEMNFIFEIKEGDWLGEKIPAQPGIDGKNIFGESVPAPYGDDIPLKYDSQAAYEIEKDNKIILYASKTGAVENHHGLLTVSNHLKIEGDVGLGTGNIDFDGSVSVQGTVCSGYSVKATGDISIESPEGITGAKLIQSLNGDIYIKGGIFGLSETEVEAEGSIFVKHVNDANLVAKNEIVIGFYSLGSYLVANIISLDENKGKIIGGKAVAKNSIITAFSGNRLDRRTELVIECLSKQEALDNIHERAALLKGIREEIFELTAKLHEANQHKSRLNRMQLQGLQVLQKELEKKKVNSEQIDNEIQQLMQAVKVSGKEEIVVKKEANPGTLIQIGKKSSLLNKSTQGKFLIEFGELNV